MDLLDDAARDCVKRSMTSRPCWRRRGRREYRLRLMQPAGAAATTASRPTAWLASPLAERHQRGAVSNVERSTHEAAGRGRRRGRGLVVLLRAAATVSAGARQAGSRDQCRQREACAMRLFLSPPARACAASISWPASSATHSPPPQLNSQDHCCAASPWICSVMPHATA